MNILISGIEQMGPKDRKQAIRLMAVPFMAMTREPPITNGIGYNPITKKWFNPHLEEEVTPTEMQLDAMFELLRFFWADQLDRINML